VTERRRADHRSADPADPGGLDSDGAALPGPGRAAPLPAPGRSRGGRRAGESGTREAILESARRRFADHGYDGATIRAIAAAAGVDPALVHHFYGSKERLFVAAMRLPVVPSDVLAAAFAAGIRDPGVSAGELLVRTALTIWDSAEVRGTFLGLLRSALTSEQAAAMLREFLSDVILGPVAQLSRATDPADAEYRAAIVASQMVGLALARYVLAFGPVATAGVADLAATIGPTLDRYLTGDIGVARDSA
jgi:AcrR family transcriptional regulator